MDHRPAAKPAHKAPIHAAQPAARSPSAAGHAKPGATYAQGAAAAKPGAALKSATPVAQDPHLADANLTVAMRSEIDRETRKDPSFYATLVRVVNAQLQKDGIGISAASFASVMANVREVHQGKISQSTAHFREAQTFGQDAMSSLSHGHLLQGAVEGGGAALNALGGAGMAAVEAVQHAHAAPHAPAARLERLGSKKKDR